MRKVKKKKVCVNECVDKHVLAPVKVNKSTTRKGHLTG